MELEIEKYPCIDHGIVECAECEPWLEQQREQRYAEREIAAQRDALQQRIDKALEALAAASLPHEYATEHFADCIERTEAILQGADGETTR